MIYLVFTLKNPFSKQSFKNVFVKTGHVVGHKYWEVEVYKTKAIIDAELSINFRQDHAGIALGLGLFGYTLRGQIYDNRHWNDEEGRWKIYTEEEGYH